MSTPQQTNRAGEGTKPQNQTNSTTTCIVGCKLPSGLLMELGKQEDGTYQSIKLNGRHSLGIRAVNGFGITRGINEAFFDAWLKKMEKRKFVVQGLVFKVAGKDMASAEAITKELAAQKTGMERLDPKNLPSTLKDVEKKVKKYKQGADSGSSDDGADEE